MIDEMAAFLTDQVQANLRDVLSHQDALLVNFVGFVRYARIENGTYTQRWAIVAPEQDALFELKPMLDMLTFHGERALMYVYDGDFDEDDQDDDDAS